MVEEQGEDSLLWPGVFRDDGLHDVTLIIAPLEEDKTKQEWLW